MRILIFGKQIKMGDRESKMGKWEKQNRYIDLSNIKYGQGKNKQINGHLCTLFNDLPKQLLDYI